MFTNVLASRLRPQSVERKIGAMLIGKGRQTPTDIFDQAPISVDRRRICRGGVSYERDLLVFEQLNEAHGVCSCIKREHGSSLCHMELVRFQVMGCL